jgi:PAS domain S-box-containing protein
MVPVTDRKSARILLVDDDTALLEALSDALRRKIPNLVVDVCESGRTALDLIDSRDYDAIVSDIRMPHMDGLTLMNRIQRRSPKLPVLLITGHGNRDLGVQALQRGAYAFMEKPLDREFIAAWVSRAIELRQLSREVETQRVTLEQYVGNVEEVVRERIRDLQEHREFLNALLDTAPCVLLMADPDGHVLLFNREAEALTGYSREEALGRSLRDFFPPSWWPVVSQQLGDPNAPGFRLVHVIAMRTKSGNERLIEWRCTAFQTPRFDRPCILAAGIDVTDRGGTAA